MYMKSTFSHIEPTLKDKHDITVSCFYQKHLTDTLKTPSNFTEIIRQLHLKRDANAAKLFFSNYY